MKDEHVVARLLSACIKDEDTGCIEWQRVLTRDGYGKTKVKGRTLPAHRAMWFATHGVVEPDLFVCHHCDNRRCLNIEHLFLGTAKDNMADKMKKGRWHGGPATWKLTSLGSNHHNAKLNEDSVRQIRKRASNGEMFAQLAKDYGVSATAISATVSGRTWKQVGA